MVVFIHRNYVISFPALKNQVFSLFRPIQPLQGLTQANQTGSLTFGQTCQLRIVTKLICSIYI